MSRSIKIWIGSAALAVLVAAGTLGAAAAEYRGHGGGHCDYRQGGHMGGNSERHGPGRHIEGKLAFLKTELGITAEQEPAWEAFAGVLRENAGKRAEMWQDRRESRRQSGDDRRPLDQRLDRHIEHMERHLAMFKSMADATKTLYGELTPEQQAAADDLLSRRHHRRFMF